MATAEKVELVTESRKSITKKIIDSGIVCEKYNKKMNKIVDIIIDKMIENLVDKKSIALKGMGTLAVIYKKPRKGVRNIKTGEELVLDSRYVVTLKKSFKTDNKVNMPDFCEQVMEEMHEDEDFEKVAYVDVHAIYKEFLKNIAEVENGEKRIEIRDLGVFYPSLMSERNSRNPRTGESIVTKEKIKLSFKYSKVLARKINGLDN